MNGIPSNLSKLAERWLDELKEEGLSSPELIDGALQMVRAPKKPRLGVRLDESRAARGLNDDVEVWDGRFIDDLDIAIVAALTVLEATPEEAVSVKRPGGRVELVPKSWQSERLGSDGPTLLELARNTPDGISPSHSFEKTVRYATRLVKHYRPDFDDYTDQEQADLLAQTIRHLKETLESLEGLRNHLTFAAPGRKAVPAYKNPYRDIRAALLKDVHGLSYSQIGEQLGVPAPPDLDIKGDHPVVRQMTNRGRSLLKQAYGEEGWRARAETMRIEAERWKSLDKKEKFYTLLAEKQGTSVEEVRQTLAVYSEALAGDLGTTWTLDEWLDRWLAGWDEKTDVI